MNRRVFLSALGGGLLAPPLAAEAQQAGKVYHIGFLPAGTSPAHRQQLDALLEGLRKLGYVQGETIVITALWPKTPSELPEVAAALAKQHVELIVAPASPAVAHDGGVRVRRINRTRTASERRGDGARDQRNQHVARRDCRSMIAS